MTFSQNSTELAKNLYAIVTVKQIKPAFLTRNVRVIIDSLKGLVKNILFCFKQEFYSVFLRNEINVEILFQ